MQDRYQFIEHFGRGGFGKITLLYDTVDKKKVIQKSLLDPNYDNCTRLIREGKLYMLLSQEQHIVDLLAYRFDHSDPCLIIPYYEEGTLEKCVGNKNWYDSILYVQHGAVGLRSLHALNGIHRDVKPSNMFLDKRVDGKKFVRLGDFGLGRVPQPFTNSTMTANACGTPEYIAPELYMPNPKFTPDCDIYSLGITGIELITGSRKRESIKEIWINNDVAQLLWEMTSWTPSARPDAAAVVSRIRNIIQTYDKNFKTVVTVGGLGLLSWLLFKGD